LIGPPAVFPGDVVQWAAREQSGAPPARIAVEGACSPIPRRRRSGGSARAAFGQRGVAAMAERILARPISSRSVARNGDVPQDISPA